MNKLLQGRTDDLSQFVSDGTSSGVDELLVLAETLSENQSVLVDLETLVHVFTFIGDVVADGLSQDEVKSFETDAGTALQVMAPSSGRFSNGFALGSFTIPPLETALYQNATVQVTSWTNPLVDLQNVSSAMATITLRRNREDVPLRNLDPSLQFFLPVNETMTTSGAEGHSRSCVFWDTTSGKWSGQGLEVGRANLTQVSLCFLVISVSVFTSVHQGAVSSTRTS